MKLKDDFSICTIAGNTFLVPIGATVIDMHKMLDLDEVSSFIVSLLKKGDYTEDELVLKIYEEYEADQEMIRSDLKEFIEAGKELGFLEL